MTTNPISPEQFAQIEANYRAGYYAFAAPADSRVQVVVGQLIEEVKRLQAIEQAALAYLTCPPNGPEVTIAFYALCEVCGVHPER